MISYDIRRILDERGCDYEWYDHIPVFTVEDADRLDIPYKEYGLKNLFLKDRKKNLYLVSLKGDKAVDLKALKDKIGATHLHFASEEELLINTGLLKGHVTPFGILNSKAGAVTLIFDEELKNKTVGIHPMKNDATVFMSFEDLASCINDMGFEYKIISL